MTVGHCSIYTHNERKKDVHMCNYLNQLQTDRYRSKQSSYTMELPASADFHVHLRDGLMMGAVVPTIRQGEAGMVYVMVSYVSKQKQSSVIIIYDRCVVKLLVPSVTTIDRVLDYQKRLHALGPQVTFLMSLYLHPSITPQTIVEAKRAGIRGVKSYPDGVTIISSSGVVDYASFFPVFAEMERQDMMLNLRGESPSGGNVTSPQC